MHSCSNHYYAWPKCPCRKGSLRPTTANHRMSPSLHKGIPHFLPRPPPRPLPPARPPRVLPPPRAPLLLPAPDLAPLPVALPLGAAFACVAHVQVQAKFIGVFILPVHSCAPCTEHILTEGSAQPHPTCMQMLAAYTTCTQRKMST